MTTITAATAEQLYGEDADGETRDGWTRIDGGAHHRTSRWHERYWLVLRNQAGQLWGVDYGIGLTENQENDLPWEEVADDKQLPMVRLAARQVIRTEYHHVPIAASDN